MIAYLLAIVISWVTWAILVGVVPDEDNELTKGMIVLGFIASIIPGVNLLMAVIGTAGVAIAAQIYVFTWLNKNAPSLVSWWNDPVKKGEKNGRS